MFTDMQRLCIAAAMGVIGLIAVLAAHVWLREYTGYATFALCAAYGWYGPAWINDFVFGKRHAQPNKGGDQK